MWGLSVLFYDAEEGSWGADDEAGAVNAPRYSLAGWLWLSYILVGIAFWTGAGFGIRALLVVIWLNAAT
jgi:hypothetical protein